MRAFFAADVVPATSDAFEASLVRGSFVTPDVPPAPPVAVGAGVIDRCYGLLEHLFDHPGRGIHETTKEMSYMLLQRVAKHGIIVLGNHAAMSCACVLISCKYCQNQRPLVADMLSGMRCNVPGRRAYVLRFEVEILQALGWSLQAPTLTGLCFLAGLLEGISAERRARFAVLVRACYKDLSSPPSSLQGVMEQDKRIAALACYRSSACDDGGVFAADASAIGLGLMDEKCAPYVHCMAHIGIYHKNSL